MGREGLRSAPRLLHEQRKVNGDATCNGRNVMMTNKLKLLSHDYVMTHERVGVGPAATGSHVVHVR
ncbi:unnamed protein product [Citrullus colocynthis]|uniref:Uncharacterized protein n=1 Tax=Citrullus colocynthis TaxID=252529 RepID=A0ABP0YA49_9ROSI